VLWVEELVGVPLAMALRPLRREEAAGIEEALRALHRCGAAHGSVDGEHVRLDEERGAALSFPAEVGERASAEADLAALEALRGRAG
jgi:hypothetical protein